MSRRFPSPLTPNQARHSLAQRLAPRADRIRQRVSVTLGVNPYRVFLTWTLYGLSQDSERGDGTERLTHRTEILPVPRITDLTSIVNRSWSVGTVPEGSIRVDRISAFAYTEDVLRGIRIPSTPGQGQPLPNWYVKGPGGNFQFAEGVDFFYEVVEDGRGDDPAARKRMRLLGDPFRRADGAEWIIALQRADKDMDRTGNPVTDGFPTME